MINLKSSARRPDPGPQDLVQLGGASRTGRAASILRLQTWSGSRREGASMLQIADRALADIAGCLGAMRVRAGQAASPSRIGAERQALQERFAGYRDEIDRLADDARFNGAALLRGGMRGPCQVWPVLRRRSTATSIGYRIRGHMGFEFFAFAPDAPGVMDGDTIRVDYDARRRRIEVTNLATGRRALAAGPARTPGIGTTVAVELPSFGLSVHLNDNFLVAHDNGAPLKNPALNEFVVSSEHERGLTVEMRDRAIFRYADGGEVVTVELDSARLEELDQALVRASIATADEAEAALVRVERACERLADMRAACGHARAALLGGPHPEEEAGEPGPVAMHGPVAVDAVAVGAVSAMRRMLLLQ